MKNIFKSLGVMVGNLFSGKKSEEKIVEATLENISSGNTIEVVDAEVSFQSRVKNVKSLSKQDKLIYLDNQKVIYYTEERDDKVTVLTQVNSEDKVNELDDNFIEMLQSQDSNIKNFGYDQNVKNGDNTKFYVEENKVIDHLSERFILSIAGDTKTTIVVMMKESGSTIIYEGQTINKLSANIY